MTAQAGGQFSRPSPHAGFTARVLPTDFDGVLHPTLAAGVDSSRGLLATKHFGWVPVLEKALRGHGDVVIVVHSTWRHEYDLDELRGALGKLALRVIASTPRNLSRYESIVFWLEQNPSFTSYRILDDDASEFPVPSPPELIVCNPLTGVSAPKVLQALADWLGPGRPQLNENCGMSDDFSDNQRAQLARWLVASDVALRDARYEGVSEYTRCSVAFDAGYYCALHLVGPEALLLDKDHPSERVLRRAAELSNVDVGPALLHLERRLSDPVSMPSISVLLAWAYTMRAHVSTERA